MLIGQRSAGLALRTRMVPMSDSRSLVGAGGSRRFPFWIFVAMVLVVNAIGWVAYHRWYQRGLAGMLEVQSVSPADKTVPTSRPVLFWHFNMDAQPRDDAQSGVAPGSVSPAVAGRWEWTDPRTLSFAAEGELPKATEFTFTLSPQRVRSSQGAALAKPYVMVVHTPAVGVKSVRQAGAVEGDRYIVELVFNDRVLPADVGLKLSLSIKGHAVHYRLLGQAPSDVVRVETDPVTASDSGNGALNLKVMLREGIGGSQGPLAMDQAFEQEVKLEKPLVVTGATARSPAADQPEIRLETNGEVDIDLFKPMISIEPAVPFTVTSYWPGVKLHGEFVMGTRYLVKIVRPAGMPENAKTPRAGMLSVVVPDREKGVWFDYSEGYLGSSGNRMVMAHAMNVSEVKLSAWRVYDNNLVHWRNTSGTLNQYSQPVVQKRIAVLPQRNQRQDIPIALDDLLGGQKLHDGVYRVALDVVESGSSGGRDREEGEEMYRFASGANTVVTLSDIGLTAKRSGSGVSVWAVSLSSARPVQGVRVRVYSNKSQMLGEGVTDADGLVRVADLHPAKEETPAVVLAQGADGKGLTWVDLESGSWNLSDTDIKGRPYLRKGNEAFIYTDRGVYRPGETVHLRAIVRDGEMHKPESFPVKWQMVRPDLHEWRSNSAVLDADGASGWSVQMPADVPTGQWSVQIALPGAKTPMGEVSFYIEEFMPNRLKATVKLRGEGSVEGRLVVGEKPITATMQADYLFGRPAQGLSATLSARIDPARFTPVKWNDWTFGDDANTAKTTKSAGRVKANVQKPAQDANADVPPVLTKVDGEDEENTADANAVVDEKGGVSWALPLKELKQGGYAGPWRLVVAASVREPGGRAVTTYDSTMLDVRKQYIGIREPASGIKPGVEAEVEIALVSPDGTVSPVDETLSWKLFHENWSSPMVFSDGHYRYESRRKLDAVENGEGKVELRQGRGVARITMPFSGPYTLRIGGNDAAMGIASKSLYVTDGSPWHDNISRENPERLQLSLVALSDDATTRPSSQPIILPATMPAVVAKPTTRFRVGQSVGVLVRSPFAGRLLLSVEADEVISTQVIDMPDSAMIVPIRITAACRPNAYISATVVRAVEPDAKWRIHRACGVLRVMVDPESRALRMAVVTPDEMRPNAPLLATVTVKNAAGEPVRGAAVTVAAVDEGVLQLTEFATPDPLGYFFGQRALGVTSGDIYSVLMPEVAKPDKASKVGGDGDSGRHLSAVRANRVKPVALVSEVLHTDAQGNAIATFAVPAFSGKLRVMAVGYAPDAVGNAQQDILVRAPLMVQSSLPRFAAPGDRFEATVTLFNNAKTDGQVTLNLSPDGQMLMLPKDSVPASVIDIKAGEQKTLRIALDVGQTSGVGKVSIKATMGQESAEELVELPIRPAAPTMSSGGYAAVAPGKPVDLDLTQHMLPGTREISVKVTDWPTLNLPDGLDYLDRYPYGCAEQTISTCFPLVYLSDIGPRIAPGVFEKDRVAGKLQTGMYRLMGMQTADGGIAMWPGTSESWPWASVYAAHLLVESQRAGYEVPADFRDHLMVYVRSLLDKMPDGDLIETQAYACYVLAMAGKPDRAAMNRLEQLSRPVAHEDNSARSQARLFLAMAQVASGRRDLASAMIPQALPVPRVSRQLGGNLGSPVRDQAMLVAALLSVSPENAALPELVSKLAEGRQKGQWRSTQDCAFAMMAIGSYVRQAKTPTPFESAELLDAAQRLAQAGKGQSILWNAKDTDGALPRALRVTAAGAPDSRAYVSWLLTGVPTTPPADADNGIQVRRRYLDTQKHEMAMDKLRSGDLVSVELTVDTPAAMENLVIEDLLPGGLEVENARLATSAGRHRDLEDANTPNSFRAARVDIRDDRLVVIGRTDGSGIYRYTYLARAITPGTYIVPSVRGECMYDIGVNSISGGGKTMVVLPVEK